MVKPVEIEGVSFRYRDIPILEDVNLSMNQQEFLALIGPNGGGKSTLLKLILGLLKPEKGQIRIFGESPEESRSLMGYLPQETHYDRDFPINVFETVLSGRYHGLFHGYHEKDREMAEQALKDVEMLNYRDRQLGQLSGGQRQRIFLARALARQPRLLLLDEPMASVDPHMQENFYQTLEKLKRKMSIILVSHDVGAVYSQADHVACLNRQLFYHGSAEGAVHALEETYQCPVDLLSHGVPHRVLRKH